MQKKVTKSNRKLGKEYRNKKKITRIRRDHRKRLKASRRKGKIAG